MAYNNAVPQANQQIASTQVPILGNFQFIQSGVGVEHNFNASGTGSDMYHLKASMPNRALSPALPGGTNGVYFISSSKPYFYDGTNNWDLQVWQDILTGTITFSSTIVFLNVGSTPIPANSSGIILFTSTTSGVSVFSMTGQFITDSSKCYAFTNAVYATTGGGVGFTVQPASTMFNSSSPSLFLQARATNLVVQTWNYKIFYRPT